MKVILLQDVKGQGKKGQLLDVSDGYARNFLLSKNLAAPASASNINEMNMRASAQQHHKAEEKSAAQSSKEKLEQLEIKVAAKAGEGGRLFGAVTAKEIAEAAEKLCGLRIDKRKIVLPEPIKNYGEYTLTVKLHPEVSARLKVCVEAGA